MFEAVVKEINNGLDKLPVKLGYTEMGEIVGTNRKTVSDMLNQDRECTKFMYYLKSAKVIDRDGYINKFTKWATLFRKTDNVKLSLEFLSANKENQALSQYIRELKRDVTPTLYPLLNVYELLAEYQSVKTISRDFLDKINSLKETLPEARFLKEMLRAYYHAYFVEVEKIAEAIGNAEKALLKVGKADLRRIYNVRIMEMKSTALLFKSCDTSNTRSISEDILKEIDFFGAVYEANAYYKMGMSYFFESPDMCLHNLKKAATIYRDGGYEDRAKKIEDNEINLAKVMWSRVKSLDEVKGTPSEAHYLVTIGKEEEALKVIEGLNADSPFTKYYEGMARNNPFMLLESLKMLCDNGSNFYAKLPELALEKFPETTQLVKLINRGAGNR